MKNINWSLPPHTINRNDRNALTDIALEAKKANLAADNFIAILDKGYHNGRNSAMQRCKYCYNRCTSEIVNSNTHGTTPEYVVTNFIYNEESDCYTCPQGNILNTTGSWHKKIKR